MSKLIFKKFEGAGNDFLLIDSRDNVLEPFDPRLTQALCHRRFGVGADGVIVLENGTISDVKVSIYNQDGSFASMCGNALRCVVAHMQRPVSIQIHNRVVEGSFRNGQIAISFQRFAPSMKEHLDGFDLFFIDTGVPHAVVWHKEGLDINEVGPFIRHHPRFAPDGVNVNLAKVEGAERISATTFERGVEGVTLACGSGAMAIAIVAFEHMRFCSPLTIAFQGGDVLIEVNEDRVHMIGEAKEVFSGVYNSPISRFHKMEYMG